MRRITLSVFAFAMVALVAMSSANAQTNTFRRHRVLRWLGQGYSDGYHRCTPGYDSSHYNPYSMHNSFMFSRTPQFNELSSTQNYNTDPSQELRFFGGVPFSIYAAAPGGRRVPTLSPGQYYNMTRESESSDLDMSIEESSNFFDERSDDDEPTLAPGRGDDVEAGDDPFAEPWKDEAQKGDSSYRMPRLQGSGLAPLPPARASSFKQASVKTWGR